MGVNMDSNVVKKGGNDEDRTSGDCISRQAVTKFLNDWLSCLFENCHKQSASDLKMIIKDFKNLPSAQPELDIWKDGTLHIFVSKGQLDKIGRVLVEENGTIFCKLFYQDTEPERKTGYWILDRSGAYCCSKCMEPCASYAMMKPRDKYCKMCGSRNEVQE